MKRTIYVKILDEDIDVWKPAEATEIEMNLYRIDDNDNELEYRNGDVVYVKEKIFSDNTKGLVAYKYGNTNLEDEMNFLEMFGETTRVLKNLIYKDDEVFKCKYFHIEDIKMDRSGINFGISLPIPKNPPPKVIKQKQNIVNMGIDILIDGKFKIDKYYVDGKDELEIFKIDVDKIDKKRYAITMKSDDDTYIYIETSFLSAGFSFGIVEDWYAREIEKICKSD